MESPFPFGPILLFAFLSALLLSGIGLRAKIPFFQRFLVPSCLLGGLLGLVFTNTGMVPFSFSRLEKWHTISSTFPLFPWD